MSTDRDVCRPEYCKKCTLEIWCDKSQLQQHANLQKLITKIKSINDPNFVVR